MRLVGTKSIKPGTILAKTIFSDGGQILIQRGIGLTQKMIHRLVHHGITYIYIEDELTSDIYVSSVISEKLQAEATKTIKNTFIEIKNKGFDNRSYILENAGRKMKNIVQQILDEMQNRNEALSLLANIFVTDDYIFQHSLNVTIYSLAIGTELKLTKKELSELGTGAMLHDIGKIFIAQEILQKPERLTDEEYAIIKGHAQLGFDFLRKNIEIPLVVAHCAFQHHERLDGSGYPRGIAGNDIHKYAKLIGVADVFDAVTSNRVYREAMLPHEGLEILYAGAVNLFERDIVEAFKRSVAVYPNGLTVKLSDGREGVIVKQHTTLCDRPVVRIIKEEAIGVDPYEVDLATALDIVITSCHLDQ